MVVNIFFPDIANLNVELKQGTPVLEEPMVLLWWGKKTMD